MEIKKKFVDITNRSEKMAIIEIKELSKKYGEMVAVDKISLEISEGEIFGLLGPNGAGKSTTISMITSLIKPDKGKILVDGFDIVKNPIEAKKVLGLVPQEIALYPTLTAKENLDFWGRMYGLKGARLKQRIDDVLEIAGLKDREKDRIDSFSGGMKRRINIAAALLHEPKIVIMDEPTVGIDPQSRNHILESVLNLNKNGMTVIYTSHYMEEVELLCSRIGIIDHGKVIALGSREELRELVGDSDVITVELTQRPEESVVNQLQGIGGINSIKIDDKKICIMAKDANAVVAEVVTILNANEYGIYSLNTEHQSLESVFLYLTGRDLRE